MQKCQNQWLPNTIRTAQEAAPNVAADVVLWFHESHVWRNAASVERLFLLTEHARFFFPEEKDTPVRQMSATPEEKESEDDPSAGEVLQSSLACTPAKTMFAICSRSCAAGERSWALQYVQHPAPNCRAEHLANNFISSSQKR